MCLIGFTTEKILTNHQKHCNGVNGTPRIEMPAKGKNTLKFQNFHKQMKAPFVIYADFEALIEKIPEAQRERTACTEKTNKHQACGFAVTCVSSDGQSSQVAKYRQAVMETKTQWRSFSTEFLVWKRNNTKAWKTQRHSK